MIHSAFARYLHVFFIRTKFIRTQAFGHPEIKNMIIKLRTPMMFSPFTPSTFLLEITFIYTFTELHTISICAFINIDSFACPGWKGKGSKH